MALAVEEGMSYPAQVEQVGPVPDRLAVLEVRVRLPGKLLLQTRLA
jgi:hypothetical protein